MTEANPPSAQGEPRVYNTIFTLVAIPTGLFVMFLPIHLFPTYGLKDLPFLIELAIGTVHFCVIASVAVVVGRYLAEKAVQIRRKRLDMETPDERL